MAREKIVTGKTTTSPALYRELFKVFYRENWKILRIVLTVLSVPCFIAAAYAYEFNYGSAFVLIPLVTGLMFVIYPRNAYRRPAKRMKGIVQTMSYEFYEDEMREKAIDGKSEYYKYAKLHMVVETPVYFFIFTTRRTASALEKKDIKMGSTEELRELLKSKCKKYVNRKK